MNMSHDGLEALSKREGSRNEAYKDVKGIWTIGVGHTGPEVVEGLVWSDDQIDAQLLEDVAKAEACLNALVTVDLQQNQFDALCSFIFNVGVTAFAESTLLKILNTGDYQGAANQLDRWHIPPSIISRRDGEKQQFLGA